MLLFSPRLDSNQSQRKKTQIFLSRYFSRFSKKVPNKTQVSLNNFSPPAPSTQPKSHSMIDENTHPFTLDPRQPLYNTVRERDCDEYHYRTSRENENDDLNEAYTTTLRDLDHERDKR